MKTRLFREQNTPVVTWVIVAYRITAAEILSFMALIDLTLMLLVANFAKSKWRKNAGN